MDPTRLGQVPRKNICTRRIYVFDDCLPRPSLSLFASLCSLSLSPALSLSSLSLCLSLSLSLPPGREGWSKPPGHRPTRMCVMQAEGSEERT